MMKMVLASVLICLLVVGCVGPLDTQQEDYPQRPLIQRTILEDRIEKHYYPIENVTCFIYDGGYDGGISCLRGRI